MFIYHNFRYHRAKAEINNLAGAVLVRYIKGNAVGAYQYRPHLSIRSPSYWQITVVERYNTDGIRYPVPVITTTVFSNPCCTYQMIMCPVSIMFIRIRVGGTEIASRHDVTQ